MARAWCEYCGEMVMPDLPHRCEESLPRTHSLQVNQREFAEIWEHLAQLSFYVPHLEAVDDSQFAAWAIQRFGLQPGHTYRVEVI